MKNDKQSQSKLSLVDRIYLLEHPEVLAALKHYYADNPKALQILNRIVKKPTDIPLDPILAKVEDDFDPRPIPDALIEEDFTLDLEAEEERQEAELDAKTRLAKLPPRLLEIVRKRLNGDALEPDLANTVNVANLSEAERAALNRRLVKENYGNGTNGNSPKHREPLSDKDRAYLSYQLKKLRARQGR